MCVKPTESLAAAQIETERRYDIDWLRVLAVVLLIYFHTARIFNHEAFYVKNDVLSYGIDIFVSFVSQWHMPLFFLLSGSATWFALRFRTGGQYVKERCKRLFIPFVFGTLVIVPPQVYYTLLNTPDYHDSYLEFYPHFFTIDQANKGYGASFEWAHLWFIIYLFVFSLIALPLFLYLKTAGRSFIDQFGALCERPGAIFLLAIPLAAIQGALRPRWPGLQNLYDDWANFFFYITFFIYGYLICYDARLGKAIDKHGKISLVMAVASMSIIFGLWWTNSVPTRGYSLGYILYQAFRGCNSWFWVVAFLSLGRKYLNFNNKLLQYANQAAYPFYILHQTVIVIIGFYLVRTNAGVMEKYLLISTVSLMVTIVLYDGFVRRINIVRFLFGLKPKTAVAKENSPAARTS